MAHRRSREPEPRSPQEAGSTNDSESIDVQIPEPDPRLFYYLDGGGPKKQEDDEPTSSDILPEPDPQLFHYLDGADGPKAKDKQGKSKR